MTREEALVYALAGYAGPLGLGHHPALIVVDVEYNFTGDEPTDDLAASIEKYRDSCGPYAWAAVPAIASILQRMRGRGYPIVYSHGKRQAATPVVPRLGTAILDEIAPRAEDIIIEKESPSALFNNGVAAQLKDLGVDTIVITGGVTSGCVRATVVDAFSHGFRVAVPADAVFDRAISPHMASLFDIDAKYGDVLTAPEAAAYVEDPASWPHRDRPKRQELVS